MCKRFLKLNSSKKILESAGEKFYFSHKFLSFLNFSFISRNSLPHVEIKTSLLSGHYSFKTKN